jgi:hypothetical protein
MSRERASFLTGLGVVLNELYVFTREPAVLDKAVAAWTEAVDVSEPGAPSYPLRLTNLGIGLRLRFELHGSVDDPARAIAIYEEAIDRTPESSSALPSRLTNYGIALRERFRISRDPEDLDWVLSLHYRALDALEERTSEAASVAANIANVFAERFETYHAERITRKHLTGSAGPSPPRCT